MEDWLRSNIAPVLANAVLATVFLGFCVVSSDGVVAYLDGAFAVVSLCVYTVALLVLQVSWFGRLDRHPRLSPRCAALLCQACLVFLPLLQFREAWVSRPGFLAGSVLLAMNVATALPLFAVIVAGMGWVQGQLTGSGVDIAYTMVSTVITGLVVYGLTRLANLVTDLHATRDELAELAVAEERRRFARDLHDLLGLSLSAITLKSELTSRLIAEHPTRAMAELAEILVVSQQAHADVRSVARGYRRLSLDEECDSAESVLAVADVSVELRRDYGELPERTATLAAIVLREGITNVLRHSKAESCAIQIRQSERSVFIDITNDGVPEETGRRRGSGIRNLSERVQAVGGTLVVEPLPDRKFRLYAMIPLAGGGKRQDLATTTQHP